MKKIIALLFLVLYFQSCSETGLKHGGGFTAENNETFNRIYINYKMDSIIFYVQNGSLDSLSSNIDAKRSNYDFLLKGPIKITDNQIEIARLDGDILQSERATIKQLVIKNGEIYADCENLNNYVFGKGNIENCKSKRIKFSRVRKCEH